jgi:hypothetical protein
MICNAARGPEQRVPHPGIIPRSMDFRNSASVLFSAAASAAFTSAPGLN